jgi:hypothetical protein
MDLVEKRPRMLFGISHPGLLLFVLLLGFVLAVVARARKVPVRRMLHYGTGCAVFGLVAAWLSGRQFLDVLLLKDTSGFGWIYVVGLAMLVAAPFVLLLRIIWKR